MRMKWEKKTNMSFFNVRFGSKQAKQNKQQKLNKAHISLL